MFNTVLQLVQEAFEDQFTPMDEQDIEKVKDEKFAQAVRELQEEVDFSSDNPTIDEMVEFVLAGMVSSGYEAIGEDWLLEMQVIEKFVGAMPDGVAAMRAWVKENLSNQDIILAAYDAEFSGTMLFHDILGEHN